MRNIFKRFTVVFKPFRLLSRGVFWLPKKLGRSIARPTATSKARWSFFFIIVVALLAGLVDYPKYHNQSASWLNWFFDQRPQTSFINIPTVNEIPFSLGLDLQGGTHLVYEADTSEIAESERGEALDGVRDVIERRVNSMGVSEPIVQTNRRGSTWRVIVELAGVHDVSEAITQIGETPLLEFKEQPLPVELTAEQQAQLDADNLEIEAKAKELTVQAQNPETDFAALASEYSEDPGSQAKGGDLDFFGLGVMVPAFEKAVFDELEVGQVTAEPVKSNFGYHVIKKTDARGEGDDREVRASHILLRIKTAEDFREAGIIDDFGFIRTELSGEHLDKSQVSFDPNTGEPIVNLEFNSEGAKLFGEITTRNINKVVAIYLDGQPISVPTVNQTISGGSAIISGNFGLQEAKTLAQRLNAGALPVPIKLISQQTVGATLGAESVAKSLNAAMIGLILVAIFMIIYYRLPGVISVLALIIYGTVTLALFKLIPVTLTLAGVAGFILSLGMAVDANVLIFERLKEELKVGRPLGSAIEEGFKRAWSSIRDGNVSTLITCFILATFSTSIVKGFAITLGIGVLISMFSAIIVTRNFLRLAGKGRLEKSRWLFGVK